MFNAINLNMFNGLNVIGGKLDMTEMEDSVRLMQPNAKIRCYKGLIGWIMNFLGHAIAVRANDTNRQIVHLNADDFEACARAYFVNSGKEVSTKTADYVNAFFEPMRLAQQARIEYSVDLRNDPDLAGVPHEELKRRINIALDSSHNLALIRELLQLEASMQPDDRDYSEAKRLAQSMDSSEMTALALQEIAKAERAG